MSSKTYKNIIFWVKIWNKILDFLAYFVFDMNVVIFQSKIHNNFELYISYYSVKPYGSIQFIISF